MTRDAYEELVLAERAYLKSLDYQELSDGRWLEPALYRPFEEPREPRELEHGHAINSALLHRSPSGDDQKNAYQALRSAQRLYLSKTGWRPDETRTGYWTRKDAKRSWSYEKAINRQKEFDRTRPP